MAKCPKCNGRGGDYPGNPKDVFSIGEPWKDCEECNGTGNVLDTPKPLISHLCPKCQGAGGMEWRTDSTETTWEFCDECKGTGWIGEIGQIVGAIQNATGTTPSKPTIYQRALNLWGEQAQIGMAIEELGELIVKLAKWGRNSNGSTIGEVADEIADVEIMTAQMRLVFGDDLVEIAKRAKLARLESRIKYAEGST